MSTSYEAIDTDPDNGAGSRGNEGTSSNRKIYIILGVLLASGLLFGLGVLVGENLSGGSNTKKVTTPDKKVSPGGGSSPDKGEPPKSEHWPIELAKIDNATESGFPHFLASTTTGAAAKGWMKSDEPCDPLLGEAWLYGGERSKDYSAAIYFTPEVGDSPGVLSAIEVDYYDYVEESQVGKFFSEASTSKDGPYNSIAVALRNGEDENLCDTEKPVRPGNMPYVKISPSMANMNVPVEQNSTELKQKWLKGSCIQNMGYHWASDIVGGKELTYKAENLVPVIPMYSSTDGTINGIFFAATSRQQKSPFNPANANMWDMSPGLNQENKPRFYMCANFCGDCQFTGAEDGMFTSMHWFFKNVFVEEKCQGSDRNPFCDSGKYPKMVTPSSIA